MREVAYVLVTTETLVQSSKYARYPERRNEGHDLTPNQYMFNVFREYAVFLLGHILKPCSDDVRVFL